MRRAPALLCVLGLTLLPPLAVAGDAAEAAPPPESPPATPAEQSRTERLRDYVDQVRAQRRAQIERLRAESRDESERAWQQHRDAAEGESRLHSGLPERWREPQFPMGAPPPGDWSNPWYYRGW